MILFSSHSGPTITSDILLSVKNLEMLLTCSTYIFSPYSLVSNSVSLIAKLLSPSSISSNVQSLTSLNDRSSISVFSLQIKVENMRKIQTHIVPSIKTNFDIIFTF